VGDAPLIEVAPGTVVLVQDVTCSFGSGGSRLVTLTVTLNGEVQFLIYRVPQSWRGNKHWRGKLVLDPGDTLAVSVTTTGGGASVGVCISGETLTNP
jgi:hypothetical protein